MQDCEFKAINGGWQCSVCGFFVATQTAPRKNCKATEVRKEEDAAELVVSSAGVGSELKKLLGRFGIVATEHCQCNNRAAVMDANGIDWCQDHVDTIVDWLQEEANKRKLPFIRLAGKILVKRAISNARSHDVALVP